jgi:hypothetical protein
MAATSISHISVHADNLDESSAFYDVYEGGEDFENVVRAEIEFLRRHARMAA